jgi:myo-inositol-1(or 4)-monophosphatase
MLELATRLAAEAGEIALSYFGSAAVERKADNSVVTNADHEMQAHILGTIARAYPDHAVRAEETQRDPGAHADGHEARYCWVIDPLDGTRNYVSGFPCFATSIAVLDHGWPVVGVVLEHNHRHLYAASRGGGATFNGGAITVHEVPDGSDVLIGIPSSKDRMTVQVLRHWLGERGMITRNLGSTALHLAMVGSGALGATFCKQCKIWDIAAGALIVDEAGGRCTQVDGSDRLPFDLSADPEEDLPLLAAAPRTHERLMTSISDQVC